MITNPFTLNAIVTVCKVYKSDKNMNKQLRYEETFEFANICDQKLGVLFGLATNDQN